MEQVIFVLSLNEIQFNIFTKQDTSNMSHLFKRLTNVRQLRAYRKPMIIRLDRHWEGFKESELAEIEEVIGVRSK